MLIHDRDSRFDECHTVLATFAPVKSIMADLADNRFLRSVPEGLVFNFDKRSVFFDHTNLFQLKELIQVHILDASYLK